jgi:hypothetical protein
LASAENGIAPGAGFLLARFLVFVFNELCQFYAMLPLLNLKALFLPKLVSKPINVWFTGTAIGRSGGNKDSFVCYAFTVWRYKLSIN